MPFLGNIGPGELIIILVIALVIFGPGRLPEIGQAVGKGIREFRRAATDMSDATRIDAPAAPTPPPAAPMTPPAAATPPPDVTPAASPAAAPPTPAPSSDSPAPEPMTPPVSTAADPGTDDPGQPTA